MVTKSLKRQNKIEKLNLKNPQNSDLTFQKPIIEHLNIQSPSKKYFENMKHKAEERSELLKHKIQFEEKNSSKKNFHEKRGLTALFNKVVNGFDDKKDKKKKDQFQEDKIKIKSIEK